MYKYKLMIADDEYLILQKLQKTIDWEQYGFVLVASAQDGIAAMEQYELHRPELIITDIRMPEMDGLQLCEWIRGKSPHARMIILSGYQEFSYAQQAIRLGVNNFILKPIEEDKLIEALREVYKLLEIERNSQFWDAGNELENAEAAKMAEVVWDYLINHQAHYQQQLLNHKQRMDLTLYRKLLAQVAFLTIDRLIKLQGYSYELLTKPMHLRQKLLHETNLDQLDALFLQYINELTDLLEASHLSNSETIYEHVLRYIEGNYMHNVGLYELSGSLGYNHSYLSRLVKKHSGKSFTELITDYRIKRAMQLLEHPKSKVSDIAGQVGFTNAKYFSRIFKKRVGSNPKEYKAHNGKRQHMPTDAP